MAKKSLIEELVLLFIKAKNGDRSAQVLIDKHARIPDRHRLLEICRAAVYKESKPTMTTRVPCTCGGENENCYRCYGSGFFEKQVNADDPTQSSSYNRVTPQYGTTSTVANFASDSRGIPYTIRERGRFDSSPVEDDYGDESSS